MVSDFGSVMRSFGCEPGWRELLYGNGRANPAKCLNADYLLNVALRPYMEALRECNRLGRVDFPQGKLTMKAEVPKELGGGRAILPFPIDTYTPQEAAERDMLAALLLPLQRAGLVDYTLDGGGGLAEVRPNEYGSRLVEDLERERYFGE